MLDERSMSLIQHIIASSTCTKIELLDQTNLTPRQLDYTVKKINDLLKMEFLKPLRFVNGRLVISNISLNFLVELLTRHNKDLLKKYILNQEERLKFIMFYLYESNSYISVNHFLAILDVGKTTFMKDMNVLIERLATKKITIEYNRTTGYFLSGHFSDIRKYILQLIVETLTLDNNRKMLDKYIQNNRLFTFETVMEIVKELSETYNVVFIEDRLLEFVYMLIIFGSKKFRQEEKMDAIWDTRFSKIYKNEYQFANELLQRLGIINYYFRNYVCAWILGVSMGDFEKYYDSEHQIHQMVDEILLKFENFSGIKLEKTSNLRKQIYLHFRCVYFRWLFHIPMVNPLTTNIKEEFEYLFNIVSKVLNDFEDSFKMEISEDEVAYLTMHFATIVENYEEDKLTIKAAIVCNSGLGTSVMLSTKLKKMFPEFKFLEPMSASKLAEVADEIDIIFSSVSNILLNNDKKVFIVKPLLSQAETSLLIQQVYQHIGKIQFQYPSYKEILTIIQKYVDHNTLLSIENDLSKLVIESQSAIEVQQSKRLYEILVEDAILWEVEATSVEDALCKASKPMIEQGNYTEQYLNAMLKQAEKESDYMVISDLIAFPHSKIENGALKLGLGITKLKQAINFGDKAVQYVLCFSAVNNYEHLNALSTLLQLIENQTFFEIMQTAKEGKEVIQLIKDFELKDS